MLIVANFTKYTRGGRQPLAMAVAIVGVVLTAGFVLLLGCNSGEPRTPESNPTIHDDHGHEDHDHEVHNHSGHEHDESKSIELSPQALKNIGYAPVTVQLGTYERTITLPGIVVERPGRTQIHVSAPLTGIVTRVYRIEGEAVEADSPLFDVRLTHEELVAAQSEFLRLAEELDVATREVERLEAITKGVVAGQRVLDQKYVRQKLEAQLRAGQQALRLHGLSDAQVDEILTTRQLLGSLTIRAPAHEDEATCTVDHSFHIQKLSVQVGQQVEAGDPLCILADHCELFVEGRAFEDDATRLQQAVREGWNVAATLLVAERQTETIEGLKLLYLSDRVDPESRAFRFYLRLPNEIVLDQQPTADRRYIEWRFKPGQRMELHIPVDKSNDRIVLPVDAVVEEGAEMYVYRQNGDHFDRVPVHVENRDRESVVVANDGAIFPGDIVAGHGAYQIHLALKNKSGGSMDPHAGHNH